MPNRRERTWGMRVVTKTCRLRRPEILPGRGPIKERAHSLERHPQMHRGSGQKTPFPQPEAQSMSLPSFLPMLCLAHHCTAMGHAQSSGAGKGGEGDASLFA